MHLFPVLMATLGVVFTGYYASGFVVGLMRPGGLARYKSEPLELILRIVTVIVTLLLVWYIWSMITPDFDD